MKVILKQRYFGTKSAACTLHREAVKQVDTVLLHLLPLNFITYHTKVFNLVRLEANSCCFLFETTTADRRRNLSLDYCYLTRKISWIIQSKNCSCKTKFFNRLLNNCERLTYIHLAISSTIIFVHREKSITRSNTGNVFLSRMSRKS